jgi:GNAT superfamily N-acetyltransferase
MKRNAVPLIGDVEVVFANKADVRSVLSMIHGLAKYEHFERLVSATEENLTEALFSDQPFAEVLLAQCNGVHLGFALFFPTFSSILGRRCCFLDHLFVCDGRRGYGVGEALMARLAEICCERGYAALQWNVLDWNEAAIRFYNKLGAQVLPDWWKCRLDQTGFAKLLQRAQSV